MKTIFRPPLTYFLPGYGIILAICLVLRLPLGLGLVVCAALSWEFYCSVTVTPQGVEIRPATWRKAPLRVPAAQVVVDGQFVESGQLAPTRLRAPALLFFSLDETDMDSDAREISIWHGGQPLEHTMQRQAWGPLRAALLELGPPPDLRTLSPVQAP